MGRIVANPIVKIMLASGKDVLGSRTLVLGIAFKENCPDVRNTEVVDLIQELVSYKMQVDVYDSYVSAEEVKREYNLETLTVPPPQGAYDVIVLAVAHGKFNELGETGVKSFGRSGAILYDVKSILPLGSAHGRL